MKKLSQEEMKKALIKMKTQEEITRMIALIIAFASVFVFFIKLLFL